MTSISDLYNAFRACNYRVSTDTRQPVSETLFFCLSGALFDGNTFAETALQQGAKFVVIDNPAYAHLPKTLLVENTLIALQQLATHHRTLLNTPIIAITGSNGKTTTKELLHATLKQAFRVSYTQGNLNNHIGVPLTLLSIRPETDIAIVEMGANHFQDIATLCEIAQPDYGFITNFGKAHLEGFLSREGVIKAKSELYDYLKSNNKVIFFNADDEIQCEKLASYENTYGFSKSDAPNAHISVEIAEKFPFVAVSCKQTHIQSQLIGVYNVDNIAAAICIANYFRMEMHQIKKGIEDYLPQNGRSQIIQKANGVQILLDAYNANPSSMQVALENFRQVIYKKKVLILGDMRELGAHTEREHQHIVELLSDYAHEEVFLVGEFFGKTNHSFQHFENTEKLLDFLSQKPFSDTFFLIKGSRAMQLERVVAVIG